MDLRGPHAAGVCPIIKFTQILLVVVRVVGLGFSRLLRRSRVVVRIVECFFDASTLDHRAVLSRFPLRAHSFALPFFAFALPIFAFSLAIFAILTLTVFALS